MPGFSAGGGGGRSDGPRDAGLLGLLGPVVLLQAADLLLGESVKGAVEAEVPGLGQEGGHGLLGLGLLAVLLPAQLI